MKAWVIAWHHQEIGDIRIAAFQTEAVAVKRYRKLLWLNWPDGTPMPEDVRQAERLL
jgi:hypothetical protein